jgi:hypothetical protein
MLPRIARNYSEYLSSYERLTAAYKAKGFCVVRVPVDLTLMIKWCHAQGYEIDGRGRPVFVASRTSGRQGRDGRAVS